MHTATRKQHHRKMLRISQYSHRKRYHYRAFVEDYPSDDSVKKQQPGYDDGDDKNNDDDGEDDGDNEIQTNPQPRRLQRFLNLAISTNRTFEPKRTNKMSLEEVMGLEGDSYVDVHESNPKRETTVSARNMNNNNNNNSKHSTSAEVVTTAVVLELTEQELQRNRTFMTIVHFVLTYPRWSLSLFLFLAASCAGQGGGGGRGVIVCPTVQQAVQEPIHNVLALVALESQAYLDCVGHASLDQYSPPPPYASVDKHRLQFIADRQWQVSLDQHEHNQWQLQHNVTVMVQACRHETTQAQRALTQWWYQQQEQQDPVSIALGSVPWIDNDINSSRCTAQDREILIATGYENGGSGGDFHRDEKETAQQRIVALTGDIEQELSAWRQRTIHTATALAQYAQNRSTYDYDYFVGLQLTTAMQILQDWNVKVTHALQMMDLPPTTTITLPEQDLLEQLRALMQGIWTLLDEARVRLEIMQTRLESFHVSIQAFRVSYQDVYERLAMALNFVQDFVPPSVPLPSFLDLSNIPRVEVLLPYPVWALPQFHPPTLPDVNVEAFLSSIVQLLNTAVRNVVLLDEPVGEIFLTLAEELLEALHNLFQLQDYNPPMYRSNNDGSNSDGSNSDGMNHDLEVMEQTNQESQQLISELLQEALFSSQTAATYWEEQIQDQGSGTLDSIASSTEAMADTSMGGSSRFPNLPEFGNATSFEYLEPIFPSFTVPEFLQVLFSFIFVHQWLLEIIVHLIRIIQLKHKYEKNATPDLPEIDLVAEDGDEEHASYYNESSWALLRLAFLEHLLLTPWMMVGLLLLPIALLGVFVWFPHVEQSCLDTRNGTFVARNIFAPILINHASVAGNAQYAKAEFQCRRKQRTLCSQRFLESDHLYQSDGRNLQALVLDYNDSMAARDRFPRCLNLTELDHSFATACCGLEGYSNTNDDKCIGTGIPALCPIDNNTVPPSAFEPIGRMMGSLDEDETRMTCWKSGWWEEVLVDSRFDCTNLLEESLCGSTACTGVNSARIVEAIVEADCEVELFIVKCCVLVLVALYHGVVVNLISSLAFNGVKRLRWRSLKPHGIQFRTHVAETDGTLVKGNDPQERLDRIQTALHRFQQVGQVQSTLSVILFLAWLVSFLVLRQQMKQRLFLSEF